MFLNELSPAADTSTNGADSSQLLVQANPSGVHTYAVNTSPKHSDAPDGHCAAGRLAVAKEEVVWFGKSHGKAGSSSSDVSMRSVSQAAVCQLHKFVVVPEQGVDGCATFTPNVRCENDKAQGA